MPPAKKLVAVTAFAVTGDVVGEDEDGNDVYSQQVIREGQVVAANDPIVKGREELFAEQT